RAPPPTPLPYTTLFRSGPFLSPADAAERTHDNAFRRANVSAAMLLASLLVPLAVLAIVFLIQRLRIPAFLAIMATVVVYGIAAEDRKSTRLNSSHLGIS